MSDKHTILALRQVLLLTSAFYVGKTEFSWTDLKRSLRESLDASVASASEPITADERETMEAALAEIARLPD